MAYRTTEHKKAIIKMVREKRVILQVDLSTVMNKRDISASVEALTKDGKLKRQKVKVRGKVGNLTEMWAVYSNEVKQQEILDFENEMINRPFVSPLVENHCYKSVENPVTAITKFEEKDNVVDINKYININNVDIIIKELNNKRVVTFDEIDTVHQRPSGTARRNFNTNKHRFKEGVDYYLYKGEKGRKALLQANYTNFVELPKSRNFAYYLITESGYLMLVKSLTDDLSWEVQRQLVDSYFKIQEIINKQESNIEITKDTTDLSGIYDFMQMFSMVTTDLNNRVKMLEGTIESMKKAIMA